MRQGSAPPAPNADDREGCGASALRMRRRLRAVALPGLVALCASVGTAILVAGGDGAATATAAVAPSGEELVRAAQRRLGVPVDGIAGPMTRSAVRSFQRGRGLPETGRLDDGTLVALGLVAQGLTVLDATVASEAVADEHGVQASASDVELQEAAEPSTTTTVTTTPTETTPTTPTTVEPPPEGPAVVGGALVGAEPAVAGGQLPDDAGLSPVPPRETSGGRPAGERRPEIPEQAGLSPRPPAGAAPTTNPEMQARLERIARCESGGNPRAISSTGRYRGKYQFSRETWRSVGGKGDPAAASEAEQDRRAAILYRRSGAAPWPVCGRL